MSSFPYTIGDPILQINGVTKSYDGKTIIKEISVEIRDIQRPGKTQGQIIGLLGPSGIGKTTLFRVLSGVTEPDTGSIRIGKALEPVEPGDVGVVAQNYPLLMHRTVLGNLVFAARQRGLNKQDAMKASADTLKDFDLAEHGEKYPAQLSGGQRQRAAIAQQMLCSKHFCIMDEPFSGLDVVNIGIVKNLIADVANRSEENTFVIITHDVTSAVSICDTIWLMGRDRDTQGNIIPGARLMENINLIEQDIAWHDDPSNTPNGAALIRNIKARMHTL